MKKAQLNKLLKAIWVYIRPLLLVALGAGGGAMVSDSGGLSSVAELVGDQLL